VIVGGPGDNGGIGAAWVFTQSNGVWTQVTKLTASDESGDAQFGTVALSTDGSTAVVGGPGDDGGFGAAWVFTQSNGTWTQQQKLVVYNGSYGELGTSVALSADGNTVIAGAPYSVGNAGAAWVFTQSNGTWTEQQELLGTDAAYTSEQGFSVALSADGNTAIEGGPGDEGAIGAAWVFTQSNGVWTQQQKLVGSGVTGNYAGQGTSIALSADGSAAIVGGPYDNPNQSNKSITMGAAWAFSIPRVTAIAPSGGPAAGGTAVTITGSNFTYATAVNFGANVAPSFTVNSAGSITAIAPAGSGTVDVTVTVDGVTTATSAADRFTYQVPVVTMIAPSSGPAAGGTSVTITGANFSGASAVQFGAAYAPAFTVNSATSITATAPAGSGTVDVTVTVDGFTSATSAADQFSYGAGPAVTAVAPNSGSAAGGTAVTITGAGFTGATAVSFGGTAAASFTVNSATSITATSPAGGGIVDVTVTTSAGTSATGAADGFTYIATPTVTAVSPNSGSNSGGTNVTITGTNFTGATAVSFGGTPATNVNVASATSITATSPAGSGVVNVTVTAAGGTSATGAADMFTYAPLVAATARTFVSASGDDASPCTRDAPCLTFAAALRNTSAGGEIDALDPGDFGPVTLTGSMTIDGGGGSVAGALVASGTRGITVNAGANDAVNLRGLVFDGYGETGASGVVFNSGSRLQVEHCTFQGFDTAGIAFTPGAGSATTAQMFVEDSTMVGNAYGVSVIPTAGIAAAVTLTRVHLDQNSITGLIADGTNGSGPIQVAVGDGSASLNADNGITVTSAMAGVTMDVIRTTIAANGSAGIQSQGGAASVTVGSSQIRGNATGLQSIGGGALLSYANNQVTGNGSNGSFTTTGLQ
jgi:hypothetical protein